MQVKSNLAIHNQELHYILSMNRRCQCRIDLRLECNMKGHLRGDLQDRVRRNLILVILVIIRLSMLGRLEIN